MTICLTSEDAKRHQPEERCLVCDFIREHEASMKSELLEWRNAKRRIFWRTKHKDGGSNDWETKKLARLITYYGNAKLYRVTVKPKVGT